MELFLIAHKVRGKLAFDVAEKMVCPVCKGNVAPSLFFEKSGTTFTPNPCDNCESTGHWWILSTVGHRAYPFWTCDLDELYSSSDTGTLAIRELVGTDEPPPDLRDFYAIHDRQVKAAKPKPAPNDNLTLEDLGL